MRAAVVQGPGAIGAEMVPTPEPGPGEVRVAVRACGICGTDLHFHHAGFWPPGATPGHEIAGVVDALGDGVTNVTPGTAVAVEPLRSCGECESCRIGRPATCPELRVHGMHRPGGMAEYVCVPASRLFEVPEDLDPRVAALAEPMAVVVHGLRRGAIAPGRRVLVLGAGSIGLLGVTAARALGADDIWLTARHPHQAELGERLGASRILKESETPSECADLVLETVGGTADTLGQAASTVRRGGTISVVGVFMGQVTLDALTLLMKENTVAWSNCYLHSEEGADFHDAVDIVSSQRELLGALTTHAFPVDDVSKALDVAADKKGGAIKVSVVPGG